MSQFRPGQSKPAGSGRKAGTPNRGTVDLKQILDAHGIDVIAQIAEVLPQLTVEKRASVLLDLMGYIYPKRKAVEVSGIETSGIPQIVVTLPSNGREAQSR